MKIKLIIATAILSLTCSAYADSTTDRISIGASPTEVEGIMESKPYNTDCSTTLGVKKCTMYWKYATFDNTSFKATFYEITFILDRVVSTNSITRQGTFK